MAPRFEFWRPNLPPVNECWVWGHKASHNKIIGHLHGEGKGICTSEGMLPIEDYEPLHPYIDPYNPITLDEVPPNEEVPYHSGSIWRDHEDRIWRKAGGGDPFIVPDDPKAYKVYARPEAIEELRGWPTEKFCDLPEDVYVDYDGVPVGNDGRSIDDEFITYSTMPIPTDPETGELKILGRLVEENESLVPCP